jgi:hemolysin
MKNKLLPLFLLLSSNAIAEKYLPIVQTGIIITKSGISCELPKNKEHTSYYDFCGGQGSLDLRFNLIQMRSVQSATSQGITENKKYVQITLDSNKSGAGIHLANNVSQGFSWFQSWAHRYEYLGGFSRSYDINITPQPYSYVPFMLKQLPDNENKNYQHQDTSGFTVGISGNIGAEVGNQGPTGSIGIEASYSYTNSRTLIYDTQDYKIVNRSSGSELDVSFVYDVNLCNSSIGGSGVYGCSWNDVLMGQSWVYDKHKISPIAYANFKPNVEVIYEAPVEENGPSVLSIAAIFYPHVVFGRIEPAALVQLANADGMEETLNAGNVNVTIDWGHPLFEAEAHVVLQSLDANNICLKSNNGMVETKVCDNNWDNIWGLDSNFRYRTRTAQNTCMSVNDDLRVSTTTCDHSLNQKWYWEGDSLFSRYQDGSDSRFVLSIPNQLGQTLHVVKDSGTGNSRIMPRLTNISL